MTIVNFGRVYEDDHGNNDFAYVDSRTVFCVVVHWDDTRLFGTASGISVADWPISLARLTVLPWQIKVKLRIDGAEKASNFIFKKVQAI